MDLYTTGLVAAHYQHISGDADPTGSKPAFAGGKILDEVASSDQRDSSLSNSNIRSGFIGTQMAFGLNRQVTPTTHIESLLAINVNGINNNRGQEHIKGVDYREAWASLVTPYGALKFGRMFGLFASASAAVQVLAWRTGVGHPCFMNISGISCGSTGAGPLYPGFDAALRYVSPRFGGVQFNVSVVDPTVGPGMKFSPYPRVDTDVNVDLTLGLARIRGWFQTMFNRIGNTTPPSGMMDGTLTMRNIWGVMGGGILNVGPGVIGGGVWTGKGVGERVPLETADVSNPISYDQSLNLREFRGFFGNAGIADLGPFSLTAGGGVLFVKPTSVDTNADTAPNSVLKNQWEYHVTASYRYDAVVFNVEYMHWQTHWHYGEKQNLDFAGAGVNYFW
jgi:predicted porin